MRNSKSFLWEGDYLILGAGAAGVQLAYFLDKARDDYLVLEGGDRAGMFWSQFPRHRKMISINKVNNGYTDPDTLLRWDWNSLICNDPEFQFPNYTNRYFPDPDIFQTYLNDFVEKYKLNVQYNTRIESITKPDQHFELEDAQGNWYRAKRLIVATGVTKPYVPEIPGIEHTENYTNASFSAEEYTGQTVFIIGKGTSAFEVANHLIETTRVIHICSPESIRLAWATHYVGHLRAINTEFLDTYLLKGQNSALDAFVEKIEYNGKEYIVRVRFPNADNQIFVFAYDRVITCTGFRFDADIFDQDCRPTLVKNDKLPAMTNEWESKNVKDLYFAGTLMQTLDFQKTHSNVIHGFRFNIMAMHRILKSKYSETPLPFVDLKLCPQTLAETVINRISTDAGMFQQQGFMGDVIVVNKNDLQIRYYQNLPSEYARTSEIGQHQQYYIITMEFGHSDGDPFSVPREKDPKKAHDDFYLHPIIRGYNYDEKVCEHHIPEHLENDWRPHEYPGNSRLVREIEYIGQTDHSQFQQSYLKSVAEFFAGELSN